MPTYRGNNANDLLTGSASNDLFYGSAGNDTINGAGGYNELSYVGAGYSVTVNVSSSAYSGTVAKSGGGTDTYTNIQWINGGSGNDTLIGTASAVSGLPWAVFLVGGAGNDIIDGRGNQLNLVSYVDAVPTYSNGRPVGVVVNLAEGTAAGGGVGTDTLVNVRRVQGSALDDVITGSAQSDFMDASEGQDRYFGGGDFNSITYDTYYAGGGVASIVARVTGVGPGLFGWADMEVTKAGAYLDILVGFNDVRGTSGNDTLVGLDASYSWNHILLRGGGGNDVIYGQGSVANRVDYRSASSSVTVDLAAGTASDRNGGTDTLVDVRAIDASSYNDVLLGSAAGDDFRVSSGGLHTIDGRGGLNYVRFNGSESVTIDLGTAAAPGGYGGYAGTLTKAAGQDLLYNIRGAIGGSGNDTIRGTPGDDQLGGGQGNNLIDGRAGTDTYRAGSINGSTANAAGAVIDLRDGLNGIATNSFGGTDTLLSIENARGTAFADTITGAVGGGLISYIRGDGGDDTLRAPAPGTLVTADYAGSLSGVTVYLADGLAADDGWFGGRDRLVDIEHVRGSGNNDVVVGSSSSNRLSGEAGNDSIFGLDGDDLIGGGAGDDTLAGGSGQDVILGGAGADLIFGEDGADTLYGEAGGDLIYGGAGDDVIAGGDGDDVLVGEDGDNLVFGEDGNDTIYGSLGRDHLRGGAGADVISSDAGDDIVVGEDGDDLAFGGLGDDTVYGDSGNDHLRGEGGNDVLSGDAGADTLVGGDGDDLIFGGDDADLILGEDGNDHLRGDAGSDTLVGGIGNDLIVGGSGDDIILGDGGSDVLYGEGGSDRFVFGVGSGLDTIADFGQSPGDDDLIQFQPGTFSGFGEVRAAGFQSGADTVIVVSASDVIRLSNVQVGSLQEGDFLFG